MAAAAVITRNAAKKDPDQDLHPKPDHHANKEVPSRIELLYTVLQTVASPLGHGTIKKEVIPQGVVLPFMAVRTRFELVVGLLLRQFSKLVVSATHPPHRGLFFRIISDWWCKGSMFFAIIQIIDHKFSQKNIFYRKNCLLPMYLRTLCLTIFLILSHTEHALSTDGKTI